MKFDYLRNYTGLTTLPIFTHLHSGMFYIISLLWEFSLRRFIRDSWSTIQVLPVHRHCLLASCSRDEEWFLRSSALWVFLPYSKKSPSSTVDLGSTISSWIVASWEDIWADYFVIPSTDAALLLTSCVQFLSIDWAPSFDTNLGSALIDVLKWERPIFWRTLPQNIAPIFWSNIGVFSASPFRISGCFLR